MNETGASSVSALPNGDAGRAGSRSTLWDDVVAYMELHKIDLNELCRRSGISKPIFNNVRNGARVQQSSIDRVRNFLDGKVSESSSSEGDFPDEASLRMVEEIYMHATAHDRILPLICETMKKLKASKPDKVEDVTINIVYAFLGTIPKEERVRHLFQLYQMCEKD